MTDEIAQLIDAWRSELVEMTKVSHGPSFSALAYAEGECERLQKDIEALETLRVARSADPALRVPESAELIEALNVTRWAITKCGGCGTVYRRCRACNRGIVCQSECADQSLQCGGHTTQPCAETCLIERAVHAAALRVERPSEWQPIETAPKDGTLVRLAYGRRFVFTADGRFDGSQWHACQTLDGVVEPTHWLPLPAPPALRVSAAPPQGDQI